MSDAQIAKALKTLQEKGKLMSITRGNYELVQGGIQQSPTQFSNQPFNKNTSFSQSSTSQTFPTGFNQLNTHHHIIIRMIQEKREKMTKLQEELSILELSILEPTQPISQQITRQNSVPQGNQHSPIQQTQFPSVPQSTNRLPSVPQST